MSTVLVVAHNFNYNNNYPCECNNIIMRYVVYNTVRLPSEKPSKKKDLTNLIEKRTMHESHEYFVFKSG